MHILTLKSFSSIPHLVHGFSTREFGTMRPSQKEYKKAYESFVEFMGVRVDQTVRMDQIHSNTVKWVTDEDGKTVVESCDGLLTREKNLFLVVRVADCIPLLFFDRKREYSGVAHSGWRGTYSQISREMVRAMTTEGSKAADIWVGIGPAIRSCCYKVDKERIDLFRVRFPKSNCVRDDVYLDLPVLVKEQLMESGIPKENIEDIGICTADNIGKVFSFRKEGEGFGEFVGIIGRR